MALQYHPGRTGPILPPRHGDTYIILIEAPGTPERPGQVKIGKSQNIRRRITALQTAHGHQLYLLVWSNEPEKELKERFRGDRIRGEIFTLSASLLRYINSAREVLGYAPIDLACCSSDPAAPKPLLGFHDFSPPYEYVAYRPEWDARISDFPPLVQYVIQGLLKTGKFRSGFRYTVRKRLLHWLENTRTDTPPLTLEDWHRLVSREMWNQHGLTVARWLGVWCPRKWGATKTLVR